MPNLNQPLFPMLSGLFGLSTLIMSLGESANLPLQDFKSEIKVPLINKIKAIFAGVFSGSLTGLLPGLGAAQASIIGMLLVGKKIGNEAFLILVGGINTVNFAFSLATFFVLEKARNGAIVAVMELVKSINSDQLTVFIFSALTTGCFSVFLTLKICKAFAFIISKINYKALIIGIITFVSLLVFLLTGFKGILVLLVSTFIGMMPALLAVKRSHNMGCLLLPVIIYFLI
jgi:putative membrane protein